MERSDTINALAKALSAFQGAMKSVTKARTNPHFNYKYADLDAIWDVIREPLAKAELAVIQTTMESETGIPYLETLLLHISGEFIKSELALNAKGNDPQAIGSAITYARRYSMSAMLGVSAEDDDDAEQAMARGQTQVAAPAKRTPAQPPRRTLTRPTDNDGPGSPFWCAKDQMVWTKKTGKDGTTWYSHKLGDGWCNMPKEGTQEPQDVADSPAEVSNPAEQDSDATTITDSQTFWLAAKGMYGGDDATRQAINSLFDGNIVNWIKAGEGRSWAMAWDVARDSWEAIEAAKGGEL